MDAVVAENLCKTFRGHPPVVALSGVSLRIREGAIHGLLGPNGAGKTTLITILIGLTRPDQGRLTVCGLDVRSHLQEVQQRVNMVRGFSGVLEKFTATELLNYYALLYGVGSRRVAEVLQLTGLWDRRHGEVAAFSSGWRQRFFIAKGILNRPQVLFMDEPTVGLDVDAALEVRELIQEINRQGCTILLTTHYMREAEELCGRIALIAQGRIVAEGSPAELKAQIKREEAIRIDGHLDHGVRERLGRVPGVLGAAQDPAGCRLLVDGRSAMTPVLTLLLESGAAVTGVRFEEPTLEDVFLKLTQHGLEAGDD
jgi:ABC-2 type transport system ATP-binding protein